MLRKMALKPGCLMSTSELIRQPEKENCNKARLQVRERSQSNIEPHEGGFRTRRAADDEPHQI